MPRSGSASSPYAPAANLLSQIIDEKKSFKKLVYAKDGTLKCSKVTYAQVCQVLSYKHILDQVLRKVPSLSPNNENADIHNTGLLHVLVYELLLGPNQSIRGGGAVKRKLMQHEPELRKALESQEIAQQLKDYSSKKQHCFPRYARVNTLLISLEEVCQTLLVLQEQQKQKQEREDFEFYIDPHVPDLLVLPPSIVTDTMSTTASDSSSASSSAATSQQQQTLQLTIKSWIQSGKIILQDKSSCFPAFCLMNGFDEEMTKKSDNGFKKDAYLDACAAPGNKTQHLAALLGGSSTSGASSPAATTVVYALDRSKERLVSLQHRMQQLAPSDHHESAQRVKIVTKECDFLQTSPDDFVPNNIGAILLDPSCSGSGIMTAPDRWTEQSSALLETDTDLQESKRVESLAKFQEKALTHAMTSFPTVVRIVYSTCSLHERENEMVVLKALENANANSNASHNNSKTEKERDGQVDDANTAKHKNGSRNEWKIVAPKCLGQWKRRGHVVEGLSEEDAKCMIRACAEDETNGFFVCCLEKQMSPKEELRKGKRTRHTCMVQTPNGTTLYGGQFAKDLSRKVPQALPKSSGKTSLQFSSPDTPVMAGARQRGTSKTKDKKIKPAEDQNSAERIIPKKVAKRLAWKKRQLEQKHQRLKQKKQKREKKD